MLLVDENNFGQSIYGWLTFKKNYQRYPLIFPLRPFELFIFECRAFFPTVPACPAIYLAIFAVRWSLFLRCTPAGRMGPRCSSICD
jgi:hypothetical protein